VGEVQRGEERVARVVMSLMTAGECGHRGLMFVIPYI
jgi:hypothetical protein